ncbi:MAG: deoxyguanosinetriphosphate triphosphohydrolase [Spirochaetes bacterium]|nr:deoxyguanosinetriphosphate triphosphohydrolase [Spirochaetota bacterium]
MIRKNIEEFESAHLSKYATLSKNSKGRQQYEKPCTVRTIFMRDRDRIIHSKYFRRLKHKTQVFLAPKNDLYRTRLTHTLEVTQIARTIARALQANEDLTEAIALAHDLGHTPFGHSGEHILNALSPLGFNHARQSLRVVDILEKQGGLNLSYEVRDGIMKHSKGGKKLLPYQDKDCPSTLEGEIVRVSDSIAYINHDIDDAIRSGLIKTSDFPSSCIRVLGKIHSKRISTMVYDIIECSINKPHIYMSKLILKETEKLRSYLFKEVYTLPEINGESEKAAKILKDLFLYFKDNPGIPQKFFRKIKIKKIRKEMVIIDYLASLTDIEAIELNKKIFEPKRWSDNLL